MSVRTTVLQDSNERLASRSQHYNRSVPNCDGDPLAFSFSLRGDFAYSSTGDIFDIKTRNQVGQLTDEAGRMVMSEKMLEIDFRDGVPIRADDPFGVGRAHESAD